MKEDDKTQMFQSFEKDYYKRMRRKLTERKKLLEVPKAMLYSLDNLYNHKKVRCMSENLVSKA